MTWLTWRQFRVPALSVFAGLAAIAAVLAVTGPDLVGRTNFADKNALYVGTTLVMYVLPAVIGVFWGVPMITRELESGTHSLVWNQTVTRKRWLAAKLGTGVLAAMLAAGVLSVAVTWWASPIDALAATQTEPGMLTRLSPVIFSARALAPVGYAAFALVLGVAAGMLLRRTVTAMAVTLVVLVGVMSLLPLFVRPHLITPRTDTFSISDETITSVGGNSSGTIEELGVRNPAGAWVLADETVDASGKAVSPLPDFVQNCMPKPDPHAGPPDRRAVTTCLAQLNTHGYHQRLVYQPADRFWPLQWLETGLLLAMTAALSWFCFGRIRHLS